jgi:multidrug efflux pump subunit AcrA (membrane-fusion protein)
MSGKAVFVRTNKALIAISAAAAIALALGGCNDIGAQHAAPVRPVLVTSVHYETQAPQRSFVGTVRPRIEADLGFRVGGKVSKRLVEAP